MSRPYEDIFIRNHEILLRILQEGNIAENLQGFLEKILDIILESMDFDGGGIYLLYESCEIARLVCIKNLPEEFINRVTKIPINGQRYRPLFKDGQVLLFEDYKEHNAAVLKNTDILSVASMPIISKKKIIGALNIASRTRYSFTDEEKESFYFIGQSIGTAVERMILEEKLRNESKDLKEINKKLQEEIKNRKYTEGKLDEKELLLNQSMEYDKLKTEFFANLSHELRTPLNIILNVLPLIEPEVKAKKFLHIAKQNSYRLLRLINNLIDITKIEANYFEMQLGNHNIISIIEDITQSIVEYVKMNSLSITFDTEVEEKIIACDPYLIERIILNILSNAIKFTESGGMIKVNIFELADKVIISIKDNGIGIPEDKINKIFERFTQIDKSLSKIQAGSGIGLSLVQSLVEMHKGKISVNSKYKEGSEFIIELPVRLVEEKSEEIQRRYMYDNRIERITIEFSDIYSK